MRAGLLPTLKQPGTRKRKVECKRADNNPSLFNDKHTNCRTAVLVSLCLVLGFLHCFHMRGLKGSLPFSPSHLSQSRYQSSRVERRSRRRAVEEY